MQTVETDRVVIVGAGVGALFAALSLAPRPVLVISPEPLGSGASSAWAQGGVAAAVGPEDAPALHAADTERVGAGLVDKAVAERIADAAPAVIERLLALGAPFDRDQAGRLLLSREAAHSRPRIVRVKGDGSGGAIMATLSERVRATPSIALLEEAMAIGLERAPGGAIEILVQSARPGRSAPLRLVAPAVLLAGGGSGGLYALTTNPPRIRGEVIGLAARAGAIIADAEFVQFHPTALDLGEDPAPLATEALRGEGAVLVNREGHRFMREVHPDAELAPRDVVARAVFAEWAAGRRPMLDATRSVGAAIHDRFPRVAAACMRHGIDPAKEPMPIAPAAHYHMGGIATDLDGRSSLERVWAIGECASTGLHGGNRLASNGLLEALVQAEMAADDIAAALGGIPTGVTPPPIEAAFTGEGQLPDPEAVAQLREAMSRHVGVIRTAEGLRAALRTIAALEKAHGGSPEFANMCATATLIAAAALRREESRGAHFRADFPQSDPLMAERQCLTLNEARAIRGGALGTRENRRSAHNSNHERGTA